MPVPSRLRTRVRVTRAAERANEERKRKRILQGEEHPHFPWTGQAQKAWSEVREKPENEKAKMLRDDRRKGDGD